MPLTDKNFSTNGQVWISDTDPHEGPFYLLEIETEAVIADVVFCKEYAAEPAEWIGKTLRADKPLYYARIQTITLASGSVRAHKE